MSKRSGIITKVYSSVSSDLCTMENLARAINLKNQRALDKFEEPFEVVAVAETKRGLEALLVREEELK